MPEGRDRYLCDATEYGLGVCFADIGYNPHPKTEELPNSVVARKEKVTDGNTVCKRNPRCRERKRSKARQRNNTPSEPF